MRMFSHGMAVVLAVGFAARVVVADTVVLKNGDTLHGKIGPVTDKTLKFTSDAFGDVGIPLEKISGFKIDAPTVVQLKNAAPVTASVTAQDDTIKVNDQPYRFGQVRIVNPAPEKWTGAVLANFALARGNTNQFTVGVDANAVLRRENLFHDDRTTLLGQYNFGQSGGGTGGGTAGGEEVTDTDNFTLLAKYDKFWTEKFYGYASNKLEHDRIAALYYREAPSIGLGYQWVESPTTNFFTEAGIGYTLEDFDTGGNDDYVSLRLAYHFEHHFNDKVSLFHDLEYLPALDDPGDYNLDADAGLKMKLVGNFVAQLSVQYKRDSTPADGALKNDLLYLVGLGWQF